MPLWTNEQSQVIILNSPCKSSSVCPFWEFILSTSASISENGLLDSSVCTSSVFISSLAHESFGCPTLLIMSFALLKPQLCTLCSPPEHHGHETFESLNSNTKLSVFSFNLVVGRTNNKNSSAAGTKITVLSVSRSYNSWLSCFYIPSLIFS